MDPSAPDSVDESVREGLLETDGEALCAGEKEAVSDAAEDNDTLLETVVVSSLVALAVAVEETALEAVGGDVGLVETDSEGDCKGVAVSVAEELGLAASEGEVDIVDELVTEADEDVVLLGVAEMELVVEDVAVCVLLPDGVNDASLLSDCDRDTVTEKVLDADDSVVVVMLADLVDEQVKDGDGPREGLGDGDADQLAAQKVLTADA